MQLQKILVVLGPPGSGKGTQSSLLAKRLTYEHIVIGDLIREYIKGMSPEAQAAKERYDKGIPQPDEIATMLLQNKIKDITTAVGAVFDTYPLSLGQAQALDEITRVLGISDLRVIFLNAGKDETVKRISNRGENRSDDKPEIAAQRFDEYEKRNAPIKDFYRTRGLLIEINGDQTVNQVHEEIAHKLGLSL